MHRNSLDQLLHLISHIDLLPGSPFKLLDLVVALRLGSSKAVRLVRVKSRMYVSRYHHDIRQSMSTLNLISII